MDSGVVAYQMTISHLAFFFFHGGREAFTGKDSKCVTLYALQSAPPSHVFSPVSSGKQSHLHERFQAEGDSNTPPCHINDWYSV